jgi:hypothetical protein
MDKPIKKYAIVIKDGLPGWKAINLTSHLCSQLGSMVPELGGREVLDASGMKHAGIPLYPSVILSAGAKDLARIVEKARQMLGGHDILFIDFPEQGFSTNTDDEYRAAIALLDSTDITIEGCLIFGPCQVVDSVTKGLRLWK